MYGICGTQLKSAPQMIGLFEPVEFKLAITVEDTPPCETWIADNAVGKLSDVQSSISSELQTSSCRVSTPCVTNGQFTCEGDPEIITYQ